MATGVTIHSDEEVNRAPVVVPGSGTPKGNRWEMDVTPNLFRNYRMMLLLETRLGIESTPGLFHNRMARLEERAHTSVDGFGAWSAGHISAGATLPLHEYFVRFLTYVGIAPFQLLPQAYRLLAGWKVFCAAKEIAEPTPAEVLYFYKLVPQVNVKDKSLDGFYKLQPRSGYPAPTSTWKHPPDVRHYWFMTSGFLVDKNPTLLLDFQRVGK